VAATIVHTRAVPEGAPFEFIGDWKEYKAMTRAKEAMAEVVDEGVKASRAMVTFDDLERFELEMERRRRLGDAELSTARL
jgi:hypothetical protein